MFYNKKLAKVMANRYNSLEILHDILEILHDIKAVEDILSTLEFPSSGFRLNTDKYGTVLSFSQLSGKILCYPSMLDAPPMIDLSDALSVCGPIKAHELFDYLPDYLELCLDNLKPKMGEK